MAEHSIYSDGAPSSTPVAYFNSVLDKVGALHDDYVIYREDQYRTVLVWGDLDLVSQNEFYGNDIVEKLIYTTASYTSTAPTVQKSSESNFRLSTNGRFSWVYSNLGYYQTYSVQARQSSVQSTNFIIVSGLLVMFCLTFFGYGLKKRIWGSREKRIR